MPPCCGSMGTASSGAGHCPSGKFPTLRALPGIHIECKRVERLNVPEAMRQAIRDSEAFQDGAPAVFHRRSREPWLVTMRLADWIALYGRQKAAETTERKE